jgi:hypothetical protein
MLKEQVMAYYPRRAAYNAFMDFYRLHAGVPVGVPFEEHVPCRMIRFYDFAGLGGQQEFGTTIITCDSVPPAIYAWVRTALGRYSYDYTGGVAVAIPSGSLPSLWIIDADLAISLLPGYIRLRVAPLPLP